MDSKIQEQSDKVRALKAARAPQSEVKAAVEALKLSLAIKEQEDVIKALKAKNATQDEVKSAVIALFGLLGESPFEGHLLGAGNPLLDISANVEQDILDKYGLKMNNAVLCEDNQKPLYDEMIAKYPVEYIAGGATQNSIRVAQWMLQESKASGYIGSVGKDTFGENLQKAATADGVATHYSVDASTPTGTCAVLVKDKERSLVANLAAANTYKKTHYDSPAIQAVVRKARVVYSAGFFLTVSPDTVLALGEHCNAHKKTFCINLSAPFITQFFSEPLLKTLPYCDFVFGNESEATAFGETQSKAAADKVTALKAANAPQPEVKAAVEAYIATEDCSPRAVAQRIANLPKQGDRARIVVITQGSEPTLVVQGEKVVEYPVDPMDSDDIVDSNGAGDSFVGGFLAGLVRGQGVEDCVIAGHYAASVILRVSGCAIPQTKPALDLKAVDAAVAKVRELKADKASEEEVKAAVEALISTKPAPFVRPAPTMPAVITQELLDAQEGKVKALKAKRAAQSKVREAVEWFIEMKNIFKGPEVAVAVASTASTATTGDAVADAAAKIRALKAAGASQEDVRAAVLAYMALAPATPAEIEAAAAKVRELKANHAPLAHVKAAVERYVALSNGGKLAGSAATAVAVAPTSMTLEQAAERVRTLKAALAPQAEVKAAVEVYIALRDQPSTLEAAAEKVRALKAAKAPQAEVKAAVEAYIALRDGASSATNPRDGASSSTNPLEAAAEMVRALKAAKAPQAEVKAAVEAYIALRDGASAPTSSSPLEAAAEKVRALKAAKAPQAEVKAAVEAYITLRDGASAPAPAAAAPAKTQLELAADRVRELKAARAPQPEVTAAVNAYKLEAAADKVRSLKAAKAPQTEVAAAVAAYVSARDGPTAAAPAATATTLGEAEKNIRSLKAANAPKADVQGAIEVYLKLQAAATPAKKAEEAPSALRMHLPK